MSLALGMTEGVAPMGGVDHRFFWKEWALSGGNLGRIFLVELMMTAANFCQAQCEAMTGIISESL